jgi:signal peptidase I
MDGVQTTLGECPDMRWGDKRKARAKEWALRSKPLCLETDMNTSAKVAKEVQEVAGTVSAALLIALVLRTFMFQPFTIPSDSMEPGLRNGDYIVVSKFSYGWSRYSVPLGLPFFRGRILGREPQRGDVIVFKLPRDAGRTDYVKRLIGLPGDRVQILKGVVYVNDEAVRREALGIMPDPDNPERSVLLVREKLPDRAYSTFSATPDAPSESTGVYAVPPDEYFFMGDNRDNSLDSRWPADVGVGFVPAENLVGKVQIILLSWRDTAFFKPWTWVTRLDLTRCFRRVV